MIGISLPYNWLIGGTQLPEPEILLPLLREQGVESVEIRMVPLRADAKEVLRAAELLWEYGFNITVHGTVKTEEYAVEEVMKPLEQVLSHMKQRNLTVTIHPIVGDNTAMLLKLSDYLYDHNCPVRIALENERKLPDKTMGDGLKLILDAVTQVNRENVGICFDMGHYAWYAEQVLQDSKALPPREFLDRVIHTHIHRCVDGNTHFPVLEWFEPLASYVRELDYGYYGVYNLELSPDRFAHWCDAVEGYLGSADVLRQHYPFHASLYEDLRLNFDQRFHNAIKVFDKKEGCYASMIFSASYLFCTNGYKWVMDLAFRCSRYFSEIPEKVMEYLGDIDLMILTHAHDDHMEESTIRTLADTDITWLLPEFMVDMVTEMGVRREKMIVVKVGDVQKVGPLTIRVLPGRHYRPENHVGLEAVGYVITAEDMPKLAFPGDVRDYRTEFVESLKADYCFAHVWLTDKALDPQQYVPKCQEFTKFMLEMSEKNIFLTHLYENARKEESMWQKHHAELAADVIQRQSPNTAVHIPQCGEILKLK